METKTALEFFSDYAKEHGLTIGQLEQEFDIILDDPGIVSAATQRIRRHEISGGLMSPDDLAASARREKRRQDRTRP